MKSATGPRDLSTADLREMMVHALEVNGWTPPEIAGYVRAHETAGWLRPNCPAWLRNSAGVYYALPPAGGFGEKSPPIITRPHSKIPAPGVLGG